MQASVPKSPRPGVCVPRSDRIPFRQIVVMSEWRPDGRQRIRSPKGFLLISRHRTSYLIYRSSVQCNTTSLTFLRRRQADHADFYSIVLGAG